MRTPNLNTNKDITGNFCDDMSELKTTLRISATVLENLKANDDFSGIEYVINTLYNCADNILPIMKNETEELRKILK